MVAQIVLVIAMAFAAVLGAIGQLSLKKASSNVNGIISLITNGWMWLFVICYGIGVIINLVGYKLGGKVSVLYPVISLSYIVSAVLAWKFLGESISGWSMAGIVCIMLGVSLIGWGAA